MTTRIISATLLIAYILGLCSCDELNMDAQATYAAPGGYSSTTYHHGHGYDTCCPPPPHHHHHHHHCHHCKHEESKRKHGHQKIWRVMDEIDAALYEAQYGCYY